VPHQQTLLVLRQCLQQNLRQLQHSLHSDDLGHLWERLDTSLANFVRRLRAAASTAPSLAIGNGLIALPTKLGGLGILSLKACPPLAFAAASEASDTLLTPLLHQDIDIINQTVIWQRERCHEAFIATRDSLLAHPLTRATPPAHPLTKQPILPPLIHRTLSLVSSVSSSDNGRVPEDAEVERREATKAILGGGMNNHSIAARERMRSLRLARLVTE
jgi:hypothetical protein